MWGSCTWKGTSDLMSDLEVVSFRPSPDQYAWTFGGAAPVMRIRMPAVLEVYTEDCFAGRVRSEQDLVRDEHRPGRGPAQGGTLPVAAAGVRHAHHVGRLGPPARGRVPHRPARHGHVGRFTVRARPAGRVPAGHP